MLYDIDVHVAFPGTIYSPGYEEENRVKPKLTLRIEATDEGAKPEVVAKIILDGTPVSARIALCWVVGLTSLPPQVCGTASSTSP